LKHKHLEELKEKYKDGFRCIRTENIDNEMNIYLKNFYTEEIDTMKCSHPDEIEKLNSFIDSMTETE